jgi:hypothetical protein
LCEQEELAPLAAKLKWIEDDIADMKHRRWACLDKIDNIRQQKVIDMSDHQVSERGFSPSQTRIIHFHLPIIEERELVCSVFILIHKIF